MKSSTYQISGCQGSQHWHEMNTFVTMPEAVNAARKANASAANSRGESLRKYKQSTLLSGEGWTVAAKAGNDGIKA